MSDSAIRVEGLSKQYRIGGLRAPYKTFRETIVRGVSSPFRKAASLLRGQAYGAAKMDETIWALKDVSFEVKRGEVVGVIGHNGAGKTTLLKILSRITEPTEGRAEIGGRVGSLLEVGTGFHPELTGRENIYLNGAILGMTKVEIQQKFDEIVGFAEVERFIDTPIKYYSSGMYVRLAFAVAAHLDPEILLVDEVLAVGDVAFQKKCLGKMEDVAHQGRTVLFVSHNMRAITDLCENGFWLNEGTIIQSGPTSEIVPAYLSSRQSKKLDGEITSDMHRYPTGHLYFQRVALLSEKEEPVTTFYFGEPLRIQAEFEVRRPVQGMRLVVTVERTDGTLVSVFQTREGDPEAPLIDAEPGTYSVRLNVNLPLMPGGYTLGLGAKPAPGRWGLGMTWDIVEPALEFTVEEFSSDGKGELPGGLVRPRATWKIQRVRREDKDRVVN